MAGSGMQGEQQQLSGGKQSPTVDRAPGNRSKAGRLRKELLGLPLEEQEQRLAGGQGQGQGQGQEQGQEPALRAGAALEPEPTDQQGQAGQVAAAEQGQTGQGKQAAPQRTRDIDFQATINERTDLAHKNLPQVVKLAEKNPQQVRVLFNRWEKIGQGADKPTAISTPEVIAATPELPVKNLTVAGWHNNDTRGALEIGLEFTLVPSSTDVSLEAQSNTSLFSSDKKSGPKVMPLESVELPKTGGKKTVWGAVQLAPGETGGYQCSFGVTPPAGYTLAVTEVMRNKGAAGKDAEGRTAGPAFPGSEARPHQQGTFAGGLEGSQKLASGMKLRLAAPGSTAYHGGGRTGDAQKNAAYWVPIDLTLTMPDGTDPEKAKFVFNCVPTPSGNAGKANPRFNGKYLGVVREPGSMTVRVAQLLADKKMTLGDGGELKSTVVFVGPFDAAIEATFHSQ